MRLSDLLKFKRGKNLFLPAHGRGKALPCEVKDLLRRKPGSWDLPELPDIGGICDPDGSIFRSQNMSAKLLGADYCWYGVNGATGLLQGALFAIAKPGQYVLMPRNVHKSIIYGCILTDIKPVLFDIPFLDDRGHWLPPDHRCIQQVFNTLHEQNIDVSAVVLVNPTYHGYASNLRTQIDLIHSYNIPVLVDEAHGTHFSFLIDKFTPEAALNSGADLVVNSLHKSLTGLVQTAVLCMKGDLIDPVNIQKSLSCLQTSSPSALLLSSCEASLSDWGKSSNSIRLQNLVKNAQEIFYQLCDYGLPVLKTDDPFRIILHTSRFGISGFEADNWFIKNGLVAELPEPGTLTFCLGFSSHRGLAKTLNKKWNQLLDESYRRDCYPPFEKAPFPQIMNPEASLSLSWNSQFESIPLLDAINRVCADLICPYPPGIPFSIPGEVLNEPLINWMINQSSLWPNSIPSKIRVVR